MSWNNCITLDQGFIFYAEYRIVGNDVTTTQQNQIFARRRAAESIKSSKTTTTSVSKVLETQKHPTSVLQKEANVDENGVYILDEEDFERIENRFKARRELLTKSCLSQGNTFG